MNYPHSGNKPEVSGRYPIHVTPGIFSRPQSVFRSPKGHQELHMWLPAAKSSGNCYAHRPNAPTPGQPQCPSSVLDGICRPPSLPPVSQCSLPFPEPALGCLSADTANTSGRGQKALSLLQLPSSHRPPPVFLFLTLQPRHPLLP